MKAVLSLVCLIPAIVLTWGMQRAYGADTPGEMSATAFADACTKTILAYRDGKNASKDLRLFSPEDSIFVGKDKYEVKIFSLARDRTPGHGTAQFPTAGSKIVGLIGKGPETDVETPHFKGICLDGVPHPSASGKDGEIEFKTADKVTTIAFRLNKIAGDHERLDKTSWKAKAHKEDNIFLVGPFAHNAPHAYPDDKSKWPTCMPRKNIDWDGGATVSFAFKDCSPSTSNEHDYAYSVHMDRIKSGGSTEDIYIDPLIINHP
jgi:hypothetical protein